MDKDSDIQYFTPPPKTIHVAHFEPCSLINATHPSNVEHQNRIATITKTQWQSFLCSAHISPSLRVSGLGRGIRGEGVSFGKIRARREHPAMRVESACVGKQVLDSLFRPDACRRRYFPSPLHSNCQIDAQRLALLKWLDQVAYAHAVS